MPARDTQTRQPFSFAAAKLPSPQTHFRLLDLYPSPSHSAPIVCDISCNPINDPKPYTALSYVWGSDDRTHTAEIAGKLFKITQSLDEALRHIRDRNRAVTLWIDQVCINQDNNAEKSAQVNLMRNIYTFAAQVLVWLGQAADDSDAVMALWHDLGLEARRLGIESYRTRKAVGGLMRKLEHIKAFGEDDEVRTFQPLIREFIPRIRALMRAKAAWARRPWFRRVWVLQEFALPRKIPVFVCGNMKVDADVVFLAVNTRRIFHSQVLYGEPVISESIQGGMVKMSRGWAEAISVFSVVRKQRQIFDQGRPGVGDSVVDILREMYVDKGMDATDERDRVFAVLGVASDSEQLGLRADYDVEDCSVIYAQVAKALIQKAGRLEVLSWSQFPKAQSRRFITPLPTWAPDWRSYLAPSYHPLMVPGSGLDPLFSPAGISSPSFLETADDNVLPMNGILLCTIEKVGDPWSDNHEAAHLLKHLAAIEELCKESAAMGQSIYPSSDRQAQAIWRVPICDLYCHEYEPARCDRSGQPVGDLHTVVVQHSRWVASMGTSDDGRYEEVHDTARKGNSYMTSMSFLGEKTPFLAREGYVGTGPRNMAPGDVVVIFAGAHIPYILRRGVDRYWEYVGEAYCDGVMDGEAWDADRLTSFYLI